MHNGLRSIHVQRGVIILTLATILRWGSWTLQGHRTCALIVALPCSMFDAFEVFSTASRIILSLAVSHTVPSPQNSRHFKKLSALLLPWIQHRPRRCFSFRASFKVYWYCGLLSVVGFGMMTSRKTVSTRVVCPWWVCVERHELNVSNFAVHFRLFFYKSYLLLLHSMWRCSRLQQRKISVSFRSLSPPRSLTKSEFKNLILALLERTFLTIFHHRHILLSHRSRFLCSLVTFGLDLVCVYHIPAEKHHSNRRQSQQHNQNAAGQDTATKTRPNAL